MELNTQQWMYDEFFVFKAPIDKFESINEFYFYINYVSHPNPENWLKGRSNSTLITEHLDANEFEEMLDWSIYESFLEPNSMSLNIDFDKVQECIRFGESYNPLFLGWINGDNYFFINYNGYT